MPQRTILFRRLPFFKGGKGRREKEERKKRKRSHNFKNVECGLLLKGKNYYSGNPKYYFLHVFQFHFYQESFKLAKWMFVCMGMKMSNLIATDAVWRKTELHSRFSYQRMILVVLFIKCACSFEEPRKITACQCLHFINVFLRSRTELQPLSEY